ncbi:MAG TPA: pirin family protein [Polyangiaceae bacterium]
MSALRIARRPLLVATGIGIPAAAIAVGTRSKDGAHAGDEREVERVVDAQSTRDGAGVRLRRALGSSALPLLDPFLLLDEMHSDRVEDYAPGFPTHPHRGFETVTYVIEGAVDHRDSLGNHGHLAGGSAQWMTAGHGIVHSEMPTHDPDSTRLWGLQLWVNLPASQKMCRPRYQDIAPDRVPDVRVDDAVVRVVAGEVGGVRGPVEGIVTAPEMIDVTRPAKGQLSHPVAATHPAVASVRDGAVEMGPSRRPVSRGSAAVLGPGSHVTMRTEGGARLLLFAARPIGEPVARSGPFVMNTQEELQQAWDDYRTGRLVQG